MNKPILEFKGDRLDPIIKDIHLGFGYRTYNISLMRFYLPDSFSPFGLGGINSYAFCCGDPVNRADPSGHMSWQGITGIVTGALGLALVPFTLGQSLTVATCVMAGLEVIAGVTAIVSSVLERRNPRISVVLGWVSMATGVASLLGTGTIKSFMSFGKSQRIMIRMAGEHNVRFMYPTRSSRNQPSNMFVFDDIINGERRLNVYGHSHLQSLNSTASIRIHDSTEVLGGTRFARHLRLNGVNYSRYQRARLVMCFSGYAPPNQLSFAEEFAQEANLPTLSYRGYVYVEANSVIINTVNSIAPLEERYAERLLTNRAINRTIITERVSRPPEDFFTIIERDHGNQWPELYEPTESYPMPPLEPIT